MQCVNQYKAFPTQCPNQGMTLRLIFVFLCFLMFASHLKKSKTRREKVTKIQMNKLLPPPLAIILLSYMSGHSLRPPNAQTGAWKNIMVPTLYIYMFAWRGSRFSTCLLKYWIVRAGIRTHSVHLLWQYPKPIALDTFQCNLASNKEINK